MRGQATILGGLGPSVLGQESRSNADETGRRWQERGPAAESLPDAEVASPLMSVSASGDKPRWASWADRPGL